MPAREVSGCTAVVLWRAGSALENQALYKDGITCLMALGCVLDTREYNLNNMAIARVPLQEHCAITFSFF